MLRETAFVHKEYKNYVQLIHGLIQAEGNDPCARSTSDTRQASRTQPHRNLKVIEEIWGLETPRKRTCEHPRRLDSAAYILLIRNPSLYLDRAALDLNLHPHRSFWLTIEITLQDVPNRAYTLRLFVDGGESEVQVKDNHTWTPSQRLYVSYFPNM